MAAPITHTLSIHISQFDTALLPADSRDTSTDQFRATARAYVLQCMRHLGGNSVIKVDGDEIAVAWTQTSKKHDQLERIIEMLRNGNQTESIVLLQLLLSEQPDNEGILYNLGMVLSDTGHLDQAVKHLRRLLDKVPGHVNARIALGVALTRQNNLDEAAEELQRAVRLDPTNPYAQRNLGALLGKLGRYEEALAPLRAATELYPDDQRAWFGLAQALEKTERFGDADEAYTKVIALGEHTEIAEQARKAQTRIGQQSFQAERSGGLRMDAVMYCLSAIEQFDGRAKEEVQTITFEIAMLGRQGLDVTNPKTRYTLRSLSGDFSGLQLVCIQYVGFKILDPGVDIGFDLSNEYAAAVAIHEAQSKM